MHESGTPASTWRKSSFSESANCVEVADIGGLVLVRDTKLAGMDETFLAVGERSRGQ